MGMARESERAVKPSPDLDSRTASTEATESILKQCRWSILVQAVRRRA